MVTLENFSWAREFKFDYIEDADILEVFFTSASGTDAIEIADDITLRFDRNRCQAVSLILNNYSFLVKPAAFGPRSFLLKIDGMPKPIQDIVIKIIRNEPVSLFLRMLTYSTADGKPDAAIAAIELPMVA
jgi:hypothetical protein